jgi:hypothetical protein
MSNHIFRTLAVALTLGATALTASSQFVIDTTQPASPLRVGLRAGANLSNISSNEMNYIPSATMRNPTWRTGISGGVVVDLAFRDFFAVQPGFYVTSHSNGFDRISLTTYGFLQQTHANCTTQELEIPVLLSFRVRMGSIAQLQTDFGPYFRVGLGGSEKYTVTTYDGTVPSDPTTYKRDAYGDSGFLRSFDWGLKMGFGVELDNNYYIGIHYLAGCRNILKPNASNAADADAFLKASANGRRKAWEFTLGYNF